MANIRSFPNNQDEYIGAEDVMRWLQGRSSGVFGADGNASVAPVLDTMAVTVSDGTGWLSNSSGYGIAWWINEEAENGLPLQIGVELADATLPRIDRVVVSWKTTDYVALPEVIILKGTPASNPTAPALTNNHMLRQISLAAIRIPAGATAITSDMITDERLNKSVCGLVAGATSVDTTMMQNQFEALLTYIQNELSNLEAGTGVELKKLVFHDVSVEPTAFVGDDENPDFPYAAEIPLSGVLRSMIPEVVFGIADAMSGNFAPIAETYDGCVYIYAASIPDTTITIPTIICWRGV